MGVREFLWRVKGLSEHSVFRAWVSQEPDEVEGHEAVSALISRM